MKKGLREALIVAGMAAFVLAGCQQSTEETQAKADAAEPGHTHEAHEEQDREDEVSDLDQPVEQLFAATCEHDLKTHECDECRYEVGVVRAAASLFEGGLLKAVTPEKREVSVSLRLTGEVRFDERRVAHVSTQVEGIIRKVHVTLGDKVKRGQPLVEIESVAIGEAQAEYLEALGMLDLSRRSHDRLVALRQEGISSEKELLKAKQDLDAAQIRTDAALGKLTRLGMDPDSARSLTMAGSSGGLVLRSPTDGTVLEMHAVAGEVAKPETSVATIGDNSALWVWADIYERDVALVMREQAKLPLAASITVKAFPGVEFQGTVDFVSPSMDRSSRTLKIRIAVPNPEGLLLAGMFAGVEIFLPGDQQVLTVPKSAVLEDERRSFVFVHHSDEYYVRRPVTPGRTFAGLTEIKKGLVGGEIIVADGAFLMKSDVLRSKMGAGCAD